MTWPTGTVEPGALLSEGGAELVRTGSEIAEEAAMADEATEDATMEDVSMADADVGMTTLMKLEKLGPGTVLLA